MPTSEILTSHCVTHREEAVDTVQDFDFREPLALRREAEGMRARLDGCAPGREPG